MFDVKKTIEGVPADRRTPYERWVEDELKLDLHHGYAFGPLGKLPVKPWPERGFNAAVLDLIGCESTTGLIVGEIPPGKSTEPVKQIFDENIYIVSGTGSCTIEIGGETTSFEWGPRSMFAIPLNCRYRLHNGSGREPVRFFSSNMLPITYNLFRDTNFIFNTPYEFGRVKSEKEALEAVLYKPDTSHEHTAVNLYDTLFVPDVLGVPRSTFKERGEGVSCVYFEMAGSVISAHVAEIPGHKFFRPHRHGPAAFVFTLGGPGYSLMWREDGDKIERFDWPEDDIGVIVPPNMWWHGHFATGDNVLTLAIKPRSRFVPLNHLYDKSHKNVKEGGTVRRYQDFDESLRRWIWETFVEECKKHGKVPVEPELTAA
jgi:hypothetical protein